MSQLVVEFPPSVGSTNASQLFNAHSHFVCILHILSVGRLAKLDYTRHMFLTIVPLFLTVLLQGCDTVQDWLRPTPNVVFIMVDTLRPDRLGIYGHEKETSPNLDAYAAKGMVFERAYAHSGWTLPSQILQSRVRQQAAIIRRARVRWRRGCDGH